MIYIVEKHKLDVEMALNDIAATSGMTNARQGNFIGVIFECAYGYAGLNTFIRVSEDAESIAAEDLHPSSLSFEIALQRKLTVDLNATDMEHRFNVALRDFQTLEQLGHATFDQSSASGRQRHQVAVEYNRQRSARTGYSGTHRAAVGLWFFKITFAKKCRDTVPSTLLS